MMPDEIGRGVDVAGGGRVDDAGVASDSDGDGGDDMVGWPTRPTATSFLTPFLSRRRRLHGRKRGRNFFGSITVCNMV